MSLPAYPTAAQLQQVPSGAPRGLRPFLEVPPPPPAVQDLLKEAPDNPWLRLDFLRARNQAVLVTRRRTGGVQMSPVTFGVDGDGRIVVSTYPQRAKVANVRVSRVRRAAAGAGL